MRKYSSYTYFLFLSLSFVFIGASCTKDFTEDNTNPNAIATISSAELPYLFTKALSSADIDRAYYQTTQNYFADIYAQYFAGSTTTERYTINTTYTGRMYTVMYVYMGAQLKTIMDNTDSTSGENALANIVWVFGFHRLTDVLGPIPYFDALTDSTTIRYDAMKDIYADFFTRLTSAVNHLKNLDTTQAIMADGDIVYDGDITKWIKFANSLKLRLALRISNVDPTTAKEEAEEAVASGVLEDNDDNALVEKSLSGLDENGLTQVAYWNGFSMSSTIYSYLSGYEDPRLPILFQPSGLTGAYGSRRNGMTVTDLNVTSNTSAYNSNVGTYWVTYSSDGTTITPNFTASQHMMCAAESYFLRAEGALNGWSMGGTAQSLYEAGIEHSLTQWGISDATTISDYISSTNLPTDPGDYYSSDAVSTTPIKWASTESIQRKQIGTQKWLAVFPDGWEAWAEFRRTGYPDMYDLISSDNTDLPVGTFIKRLTYPATEATSNEAGLATGITLLGGQDKASVQLWWDVD
ncbi:MAG: SusD/RagB family nutrient-binding outer membrane lipoprotein [Chitinophagaceae bacterium]